MLLIVMIRFCAACVGVNTVRVEFPELGRYKVSPKYDPVMVTFRGMDDGVYVTVHEPDDDNVHEPKLVNVPPASPSENVTTPVGIAAPPPGPAPSPKS